VAEHHVREPPFASCVRVAPYTPHQVGFDIVDVQVKLEYLQPELSSRMRWMHGNLYVHYIPQLLEVLITAPSLERLPFEDNEFDHVHLFTAALSVPEDKVWFLALSETKICPFLYCSLLPTVASSIRRALARPQRLVLLNANISAGNQSSAEAWRSC
jgi:hypothetical protein